MFFRQHNAIFVHIPKTGGTSIEDMLWPNVSSRTEKDLWQGFTTPMHNKYQTGGLQHLCAHQIRKELGEETFRAAYKFTVVRNPWDKAVSQFVFMRKRPDLMDFIGMQPTDDFKTYLEITQRKSHVQWMPQYMFILDQDGTTLVDHILRFETFESDVKQTLAAIGAERTELLHQKKGDRTHYTDYYDEDTKTMVAEAYSTDIRMFGYRYNTENN